jgi:hypothetical protein
VFVGEERQWRVTWLSKYQLPLAAGGLVLLVAALTFWVRRRPVWLLATVCVALLQTVLTVGYAFPEELSVPGLGATVVSKGRPWEARLDASSVWLGNAQGGRPTKAHVRLDGLIYEVRVTDSPGSHPKTWGATMYCYELRTTDATPKRAWFFCDQLAISSPHLVNSPDGDTYFAWVQKYSLYLWDLSQDKPYDMAVAEYVHWLRGATRTAPRIRVYEHLHRYYLRLPRTEGGARITLASVRQTPSGEKVVRLRGALPLVTFTFIGDGQEWRVTWLSKYQLPLAAGGLVLLVAALTFWVRRRRRRAS